MTMRRPWRLRCLAASALLAAGQPEDALTWAGWVTARREATLGPDHPATIMAATVAWPGAGRRRPFR